MSQASSQAAFMKKVRKEPTSGCWLWTGAMRARDYGSFRIHGEPRSSLAHRAAWRLFRGPLPENSCVLHCCDTPACVNPEHLFLGTQLDNAIDREAKHRGNHVAGTRHGMSKLTPALVLAIRADSRTYREIAAEIGVTAGLVGHVKRHLIWRHVP